LFLGFFFILISILGSFSCFAESTGEITDKIPNKICSTEEKTKYNDLGTVKVSPENEMEIAQKETEEVS
jgi:hypothetical protein